MATNTHGAVKLTSPRRQPDGLAVVFRGDRRVLLHGPEETLRVAGLEDTADLSARELLIGYLDLQTRIAIQPPRGVGERLAAEDDLAFAPSSCRGEIRALGDRDGAVTIHSQFL